MFYRHFIAEKNATYNVTLTPIIGNPALLIKVDNVPIFPTSLDVDSWDIKLDKGGETVETILIDEESRQNFEI